MEMSLPHLEGTAMVRGGAQALTPGVLVFLGRNVATACGAIPSRLGTFGDLNCRDLPGFLPAVYGFLVNC